MTRTPSQYFLYTLIASFAVNAAAAVNDASMQVKWGYKGNISPERWGQLSQAFELCAAGKSQSPIDIPRKVPKSDYALTLNYHAAPMIIEDDGATDLMIGNTETIVNDGHSVQLNFHGNRVNEMINFAGEKYKLVQFHFHTPSENQWRRRSFPLEMHFVHQGSSGKIAVIGVFINGGDANPELQKIIDNLPHDINTEHEISHQKIDPSLLFPSVKDYYSFMGSLTTPPCSEGLQWILMSTPITASPAQILQLRQALGGINARAVQPINHRAITYSVEKKA